MGILKVLKDEKMNEMSLRLLKELNRLEDNECYECCPINGSFLFLCWHIVSSFFTSCSNELLFLFLSFLPPNKKKTQLIRRPFIVTVAFKAVCFFSCLFLTKDVNLNIVYIDDIRSLTSL